MDIKNRTEKKIRCQKLILLLEDYLDKILNCARSSDMTGMIEIEKILKKIFWICCGEIIAKKEELVGFLVALRGCQKVYFSDSDVTVLLTSAIDNIVQKIENKEEALKGLIV